ncbi:DUF1289 domain-containing protein [Sphingomonas sp.]|uniref:DUF1289 domain-containing protein n=1 Tax=Sphingomonas sp. TaxID=28214 RepID=UPI0035BC1A86
MGGVEIESPCTGVCTLDADRCIGCGRTLDEIAWWTVMSAGERARVMARTFERSTKIRATRP